jgi:pyruvate dehydrogenase E1 component alpha subunit
MAARAGDAVITSHRGHGQALAKGADPALVMAELAGRADGLSRGRGGTVHLTDVSHGIYGTAAGIIGAGVPIAAGLAWAARRAGADRVVLCFFGDGAVNQGVVFEAFNLAALWQLPVVFVCENNGYATTLPAGDGNAGSIVDRARAFGITSSTVDGMDPETVHASAAEALARARAGDGPVFVEYLTYRFEVHHTRDYTQRMTYRTDDEVAAWRARDPVETQGARLTPADRAHVDAEVEATMSLAVRFALASPPPDPVDALDHLYATGLTPRPGMV